MAIDPVLKGGVIGAEGRLPDVKEFQKRDIAFEGVALGPIEPFLNFSEIMPVAACDLVDPCPREAGRNHQWSSDGHGDRDGQKISQPKLFFADMPHVFLLQKTMIPDPGFG